MSVSPHKSLLDVVGLSTRARRLRFLSVEKDRLDARGPSGQLLTDSAGFALWLTAAFGVGAFVSSDRYPAFRLFWTAIFLGACLLIPPALLRAIPLLRRAVSIRAWTAFVILFAAALSFDVPPRFYGAGRLDLARSVILGGCLALAAWNLRRGRASALDLGGAMAIVCLAWIACGALRIDGVPPTLRRFSSLLPLLVGLALLMPGLPRIDPLLSRLRLGATVAAATALVVLPLVPRPLFPEVRARPVAPVPAGGRSAVLIVLDTLRRDHMSLYGYARRTTPALERWARNGVVFDDATTVAAWTLPSHASMFTGLWPRTHGAHGFHGEPKAANSEPSQTAYPLAQERLTLAEIAREHGYRTAGFTANHYYLSSDWGLDQGFEEYLCRQPMVPGLALATAGDLAKRWSKRRLVREEMPYFNASELTLAARAWLESHGDRPFFLFLNYMEAHVPNAAPGSQGLAFEDEAYVSGAGRWRPSRVPAEQRSILNEYDREVIHLDHWLGVLLDYLRSSGLAGRTLVILTSDHGEFLGEHEFLGHGKDLYSESLDVPLIVWEPGAASGRVSRPVQTPDIFASILRYLELPIPEGTQGQPLLEADHATVSEEYYAPFDGERLFDRVLRTIRVGDYRYALCSTGEERLFHLTSDPHEMYNLISERPEVARAARATLDEWLRKTPEAPPRAKPRRAGAREIEALRALGYIQ